ncbi:cholest-4-en-3-one 26-monooxygenase [Jatrophihabitans sp. GAS493]|uniref:cytochrome P450 n=1 Tax=Jatrophihabitans sp. GAS493 TaxID=1907575 RepID=UPI000BB763A3|nr:cytochrome P450 [Jatrophihabitans sp. GAS493]SOD75054.1 cholest-4-en-3-one 26-monooxygenase [Jatrophihabitans sp. GAS493]
MALPQLPDGFDVNDPNMYAQSLPHEEWAELRRTAPVWWQSQPRGRDGFDDDGHWVLTRHADVKDVSRQDSIFSTYVNTSIIRFRRGIPRQNIDMQRVSLLNMDAPKHTRMRGIISRGFTPRAVNGLRQALQQRARAIVEEALVSGQGEFVRDVASRLPLQAIAELLGVPPEETEQLSEWSSQMVSYDDPDSTPESGLVAGIEMQNYFMDMALERRACPANDIVTKLVTADIDGNELSPDEFGFFTVLLSVAGSETTRHAISHGMVAFMEHHDQWERFKRDRPATAADEIVRWSTPIVAFQRTALEDTMVGGQAIKAGDRLGLYYASANFDEEVFTKPREFDILRDPNPHVGFGGSGPHYCIGASLARLEISLIFDAIADCLPDISMLGEPKRLHSSWMNGIKALPVQYTCPVAH